MGESSFIAINRRRKAKNPERDKPRRSVQSLLGISVMQEERTQDPGCRRFIMIAKGRLNMAVQIASTGTGTDWNITWSETNRQITAV